MKAKKNIYQAHTAPTQNGTGDYYGTGIKAKVGKLRSGLGPIDATLKGFKTPPKTLA